MAEIANKIGRYEIVERLGEGAMGVVYKAHDTIIDRTVAIKTVKMTNTHNPAAHSLIKQFCNEAKIAGRLSHPNIAVIHDVGEQDSSFYLVFEYVKGVTLKDLILRQEKIPINDKIALIILLARTLHYAHQHGVIHRDIKPANVMVLDDLQIKVMDFGIAVLDTQASKLDDTMGIFTGTPYYMSPEMVREEKIDKLTDVFSLGVLSYEFLTGVKPFMGVNFKELFECIETKEPEPPQSIAPSINETVSHYIMKTLEKDKQKRYQSAGEFADALEFYMEARNKTKTVIVSQSPDFNKLGLIKMLQDRYLFFSDFTEEEMLTLFSLSGKKIFRKGSTIFKEASVDDKMYIIIAGQVKLIKRSQYNGKVTLLKELKSGDCFGELGFLNNSPRYAAAIPETDTVCILISDTVLRKSEPYICLKLYKNLSVMLSERIRQSDERICRLTLEIEALKATTVPPIK
ncbi:serine/threonine-protein kinase [Candidatus Magnetominusculus xianensis]|uniref:Serine/threonine protein kinase n=1 Tax=Candidatus Magnetominusculus xianensis TaxID=1748249 RepID=A0ABR5SD25_9BACT|nr:serine/threonine-protein kinase [Candidatus Magnetominusculus xianensis]KWT82643.1 serine/threonine protein kinase [Candidatus Magnetominusculus xianensis]MBF0405292.1 protein kinase [Nitrospirota bacterium]